MNRVLAALMCLISATCMALAVLQLEEALAPRDLPDGDAHGRILALGGFAKFLGAECPSPVSTTGAVNAALSHLDEQDLNANYDKWAAALLDAERTVMVALACLPTDGNLWVRLAMIRQAIAEHPTEVRDLLALSQLYAPVELNAISARIALLNRLTPSTQKLTRPIYLKDAAIICQARYKWVLRQLPAPSVAILRELDVPGKAPSC